MENVIAVLFDFGGTLFDYYPSNAVVWSKVAAKFGVTLLPDDPNLLNGLEKQTEAFNNYLISRSSETQTPLPEIDWTKLNGLVAASIGLSDPNVIPAIQEAFSARVGSYKIFSDCKQTLKELKLLNKRLGLVSNTSPQFAVARRPTLQENGILDYFETIILSSEVGVSKPDSKIFEIALKEMNLEDQANDVMYVGDNYFSDVIGARNAGLVPVLLDTTGLMEVDCLQIQNLAEILHLLK